MGLGRNLIQAAFLCGALAMAALARGAEISAEDAFLTRLSIGAVPRLQREYLRLALGRLGGERTTIDLDAYVLAEVFERWYVEGVYDGIPSLPHEPIPGEDLVVTGKLIEQWQLSPFMPYYLEVTEIPSCANSSILLPNCR
ncbi:hypothetical protein GR198_28105 [Rhizobium leguminosarum]|uniref:hypothetical protein n=1 Tax=Rhizobium leguminosarum TaxID=384 RepID=UPI0013BECB5B|nr:hypothetical protein [Rhizobium leguminosarum]MBY5329774.1 hypothetical protein [Rhizobium leguminosarum]NEH59591.1 hypothetical protein [Rhizobium leguminosarum]